jgi:hypothetical protein
MEDREALQRLLPHLQLKWLIELNERVEWLKEKQSGNAQAFFYCNGGILQPIEWTIRDKDKNRP